MESEKTTLKKVTEGNTSLLLYIHDPSKRGPGKKQGLPFYNPSMQMNRDISIAVLQYLVDEKKDTISVLDGLASSGIRGFRFLNEVSGSFQVTINDWSEDAFYLIKKNAEKLKSENIVTANESVHSILAKQRFDYIDIDPFGSPATYIDSALNSIKHRGIIAFTATDTATLCGVYPKVCRRRYNAQPLHGPCMHETGLRILIGHIGRQAGKYDKGITPILSYSTDHYMRTYLLVHNSVSHANNTIENIKQIPSTSVPGQEKKKEILAGPLWTGSMHDKKSVSIIRTISSNKTLQTKNTMIQLFDIIEQEADMPAFYYSSDTLSKQYKTSPPSRIDLYEIIEKKGYEIKRTQFDPTGFKTTAPKKVVIDSFQKLTTSKKE